MSGARKSLKNEKTVHGIVVKKLPIGPYIEALEALGELPVVLLDKLYPETPYDEAISYIRRLNKEDTLKLLCKGLTVLPNEIILFISKLLQVDSEKLRQELTPLELMDVIMEFWEMNKLSNFIVQVKALVMTLR